MGIAVDAEAFKEWLSSTGSPRLAVRTETTDASHNAQLKTKDDTPHSEAFSRIVELIKSGEPIPGVKEVPDIINRAPPSLSIRAERKKPWELKT
jgi:hypothetical protein